MMGIIEKPITKQEVVTSPVLFDSKANAVAIVLKTESADMMITESL